MSAKYVVVCDCDGAQTALAWINDERPSAFGINFGATSAGRGELRLSDGPNHTIRFGHQACGLTIAPLSRRNIGELVDGVVKVQREIGSGTVEVPPMTWKRGETGETEQRVVIPLALLCLVNGRLQRGGPTPRR